MIVQRVLSMVFLRVCFRRVVCRLRSLASRLDRYICCLSLHRIHVGRSGYQRFDLIGVDLVDERWNPDQFHVDADEQSHPADRSQSNERMVDEIDHVRTIHSSRSRKGGRRRAGRRRRTEAKDHVTSRCQSAGQASTANGVTEESTPSVAVRIDAHR